LDPGTGDLSQNGQKPVPLIMSPTKNSKPQYVFPVPTRRLAQFFRVWIALQRNQLASYGVAKWCEISAQCVIS